MAKFLSNDQASFAVNLFGSAFIRHDRSRYAGELFVALCGIGSFQIMQASISRDFLNYLVGFEKLAFSPAFPVLVRRHDGSGISLSF